jgi:CRISPR-associated protein Csm4
VEVGDKDPLKEMEEHYKKHIKTEIRPRVQIERLTGAARLYFFGMVSFAEGSGLYCFVRCPDAALLDRLKIVVRALGEIGLGGERSSGYGRFTTKDAWETIELDLPGDQDANGWVTLSLYHPSDQDWSDANVVDQSLNRYKFVDRAGWVVSPSRQRPVRRKSVMMFEEGTSFKMSPLRDPDLLPNRIVGHLVDVTPEGYLQECGHCVYRYGFAFNVPAVLP